MTGWVDFFCGRAFDKVSAANARGRVRLAGQRRSPQRLAPDARGIEAWVTRSGRSCVEAGKFINLDYSEDFMGQYQLSGLKTFSNVSSIDVPRNKPWQVSLDEPAASVMTDFHERAFFKVDENDPIEEALSKMKHAGLRAAFVVDEDSGKLLGMITAYDILGEKPMRYLQSIGYSDRRGEFRNIRVADIMEQVSGWVVTDMHCIEEASVQSILEALQKCSRTHLPVLESKEGKEPRLRGLFSLSKLLRLTEDSRKRPELDELLSLPAAREMLAALSGQRVHD
jgi:CBS domain-containing protein